MMAVTEEEVRGFVQSRKFGDYQKIELPFGVTIPGRDRRKTADLIFPKRLDGKKVLDVGCHYGYYVHEALKRGASRAVGIEADPERFSIAKEIARLQSNGAEIIQGKAETTSMAEQFDLVLLLNVLHHTLDPIDLMLKLASLCRETMVVEFCLPSDDAYLSLVDSDSQTLSFLQKLRSRQRSLILKWVCKDLPIITVGAREYHRTFYFSRSAFVNLFTRHHKLFSRVEFKPSLKKHRTIAVCQRV